MVGDVLRLGLLIPYRVNDVKINPNAEEGSNIWKSVRRYVSVFCARCPQRIEIHSLGVTGICAAVDDLVRQFHSDVLRVHHPCSEVAKHVNPSGSFHKKVMKSETQSEAFENMAIVCDSLLAVWYQDREPMFPEFFVSALKFCTVLEGRKVVLLTELGLPILKMQMSGINILLSDTL